MLTPREFGLISMITIFIAVSESFINSGFSKRSYTEKGVHTGRLLNRIFF